MKISLVNLPKLIASNLMMVITIAVVISMMLVTSVGLNVWKMSNSFGSVVATEFQLQRLSSEIIYLDEVLTMSARMAASTGDLQWEQRYNKFEPELDNAIKKVIKLAPEAFAGNTSETDVANTKLVEMEKKSFDLARQGKLKESLELLFSQEYNLQKKIYADGIGKTTTAISTRVESNLGDYRLSLFWSSLFSIISVPVLIAAWVAVLTLVRWYIGQRKQAEMALQYTKNQLEQVNGTLEIKVVERTVELESASKENFALNERLNQDNLRMKTELDLTRQVQQRILPSSDELAEISGLEIAGFMQSASEVGGDYYDILHHDGRVKIGIGDVTGHGLESGMLMMMVQTAVRTLLESDQMDPIRFLDILNRTIYHNIQRMNSDKTMTLCLLDYQDGKVRISGQHEEMLVIRRGGLVQRVSTTDLGFPIGLEKDISEFVGYADIQLLPGDVIVLYTDGITEAEDINEVQYGLKRLTQVVKENWQNSVQEIKQAVIDDLQSYIGERKLLDDITLVVLKQKQMNAVAIVN
jgi:serine phosphatase RsbU (regulator of sigma subunit)